MSARDVIADVAFEGTVLGAPIRFEMGHKKADAILSALDKAGYAVVPKEPTTEMYFAFYSPDAPSVESVQSLWTRRYKAMLTAAKETK